MRNKKRKAVNISGRKVVVNRNYSKVVLVYGKPRRWFKRTGLMV
ncbi:hypothetical protein [Gynurincola endophyticus]|nr:hypothetical protein [Gynurincola endophyticus]